MKSTIKVDFANPGELPVTEKPLSGLSPIIRINFEESDDLRDKFLKQFIENIGYQSNYLRVDFHLKDLNGNQTLIIQPAPDIENIKRNLESISKN